MTAVVTTVVGICQCYRYWPGEFLGGSNSKAVTVVPI